MVTAHLDSISVPRERLVEVIGSAGPFNSIVLGVVFLEGNGFSISETKTDSCGNFKLQFLITRRLRPKCNGTQSEFGRVHVGILAAAPIL